MVLSDVDIQRYIAEGKVKITPVALAPGMRIRLASEFEG
jgi:hypothetical protein